MTFRTLLRLSVVLACAIASCQAAPIFTISGTPVSSGGYTSDATHYLAYSWTQSVTYADVVVSVMLQGFNTGNAYITTSLGPGTTNAAVISSTALNYPAAASTVNLFSGITLGPGTYWLLVGGAPGAVNNVWTNSLSPVYTTGTGVTRPPGYIYADSPGLNPAFPPGSTFNSYPYDNFSGALLSITGTLTAAPEPSTAAMAVLALGLGWVRARRRDSR